MSLHHGSGKQVRTSADLATMVARVGEATAADAAVCVTDSGSFARHLAALPVPLRLIAATSNEETFQAPVEAGLDTLRLPLHAADKYSQVRHALSVGLRAGRIAIGDLVVCAIGCSVYPEAGDLVVLTDVEPSVEHLAITDLLRLTYGIRPQALEAALKVASKIGRVVRRGGVRSGAIFVLGDSLNVLKGSRQLVPNPFHGHEDSLRRLTNPAIHDALVELSKLDGAFVVHGDGYIQSAAVFLATSDVEAQVPSGLGARHFAAAAITACTAATAIVVSATDGIVRAFAGGQMVLGWIPTYRTALLGRTNDNRSMDQLLEPEVAATLRQATAQSETQYARQRQRERQGSRLSPNTGPAPVVASVRMGNASNRVRTESARACGCSRTRCMVQCWPGRRRPSERIPIQVKPCNF